MSCGLRLARHLDDGQRQLGLDAPAQPVNLGPNVPFIGDVGHLMLDYNLAQDFDEVRRKITVFSVCSFTSLITSMRELTSSKTSGLSGA